jgi:hypothetical protein
MTPESNSMLFSFRYCDLYQSNRPIRAKNVAITDWRTDGAEVNTVFIYSSIIISKSNKLVVKGAIMASEDFYCIRALYLARTKLTSLVEEQNDLLVVRQFGPTKLENY